MHHASHYLGDIGEIVLEQDDNWSRAFSINRRLGMLHRGFASFGYGRCIREDERATVSDVKEPRRHMSLTKETIR